MPLAAASPYSPSARRWLHCSAAFASARACRHAWRTLLTEPPSIDHQELAVLGLIEIEGPGETERLHWLAMLTPAGQLQAHRIMARIFADLGEDGAEAHPS